ncbi:MAG: thiamine phosphate synthase [Bacteroidales bacterium]|jgi:thiamine-phosphate pyrophosphorylase|nr:thiamine phosphate synthase [Bacteroidales bacterium]
MDLDLSLYLVTDRKLSLNRPLEWVVEEAVRGGVTVVQLREKDCDTREFVNLAIKLKQILSLYHVPLLINDRIDIALAADADGVHIGQSDMPYHLARKILGYNKVIGLSIENFEEAEEANKLDVDYIAVSPVFSTHTKTNTKIEFGFEGVKKVVEISKHPVIGIGNINVTNIQKIMQMGADGVAVVSAIMSATNIEEAARILQLKMKEL